MAVEGRVGEQRKKTREFEICWFGHKPKVFHLFHLHYEPEDKAKKNPAYRVCVPNPETNGYKCRVCEKEVPKGIIFTAISRRMP